MIANTVRGHNWIGSTPSLEHIQLVLATSVSISLYRGVHGHLQSHRLQNATNVWSSSQALNEYVSTAETSLQSSVHDTKQHGSSHPIAYWIFTSTVVLGDIVIGDMYTSVIPSMV